MTGKRPIQRIGLGNFLSYGIPLVSLDLMPLNVLIGPNASGKSNLVEAFSVLRGTAGDLAGVLREGGGISEYTRKDHTPTGRFHLSASIEPASEFQLAPVALEYFIEVRESNQRAEVFEESIWRPEHTFSSGATLNSCNYYVNQDGSAGIRQETSNGKGSLRPIRLQDLTSDQSILSQRRDPDLYPELTSLGDLFRGITIYREWTFGSRTKSRAPQPTDLPTDFLLPDAGNLALVLHELLQRSVTRKKLIEYLKRFYAAAEHIATRIHGGTVQLFIDEGRDELIPATRLSDGTLRYLSLLSILCHPTPPPIVCIEEPELGLHPDILPTIAELLKDASQRTQLIVTTHSDALVSALSDIPEAIVVCEPSAEGTQLRRLDRESLAEWLERYSLGEIWRMGEIGGTRW
jgi:predicted ATPase